MTTAQVQSRHFIKSKFEINAIFSNFNAPPGAANPDPRRPLVLVLLKPGCQFSRRFKRQLGELASDFEHAMYSSRLELKVFECPADDTCAKVFNAKFYPEIRFYSARLRPRRFFLRFPVKGPIRLDRLLSWLLRRSWLANGASDMLAFDGASPAPGPSKAQLDAGQADAASKPPKPQANPKALKLKKQMAKMGYFYGSLGQMDGFGFWERVYKRMISRGKELLIFCRDALSKKEYFVFRKITALYPSVRVVELRRCLQWRASADHANATERTSKFIAEVFGTETKSWPPELGRFMLRTFSRVWSHLAGGNNRVHLVNFEHFYSTSFGKKSMASVSRFRRQFKARRRPNVHYLTSSLMRKIMHNGHSAMLLFLNPAQSQSERASLLRSFRELSRLVRFDKSYLFVVVGGNGGYAQC